MCLAGAVVPAWFLPQEVACLSPFTVMTNIFITEFSKFSEIFRKNSIRPMQYGQFAIYFQDFRVILDMDHHSTHQEQALS